MGRKEKPLDDTDGSLTRFASGLRQLRREAGSPSYRVLAEETHFSVATLSRAAAGNALPSAEVVSAFVAACGGDVGHWLAEHARLKVVLAVDGTGRTAAVPTPGGSSSGPAQLPADVLDFTGRHAAVDELARLVGAGPDDGPARPVVISAVTGTGGVGKTTLAVHVGHQVLADFPDGQLYVDLRGAGAAPRDPAEVLQGLLRDLGEPEQAIPPDEQGRAARFRTLTAQRRLLIVLDDARDAAQVRPLLPGSGTCAVLVTSRRRLPGLTGALPLHLEVLTPAEALALFTSVVGAARAAAEPDAVQEVLRYCGGLPLAIRIAASRLASRPMWSVATLAARLVDEHRRLDELRVEDTAVRASFLVSYRALADGSGDTAPAAEMFRLLGLWAGPDISLPAAAALAGLPQAEAEEILELLVDENLVQAPAPGRYRLHDLLRVFAHEVATTVMAPQARTAAVTRLLHWYIGATASAADSLRPTRIRRGLDRIPLDATVTATAFDDREAALRWLLAEHDNLAAAITQADEQLPGPEAWVLAQQASYFYDQRGLWSDTYATHQVGLRCARRLADATGRSLMLAGIAAALNRTGRSQECLEAASESAAAAEETGDRRLMATMRLNRAGALLDGGRAEEAVELFGAVVADFRVIGDPHQLATALLNHGVMLSAHLQRFKEADACFEETIELARAVDAPLIAGRAVYQLANSRARQGDTAAELSLLTDAADIFDRLGNRTDYVECLECLADARLRGGQAAQAQQAWAKARTLLREMGDTAVTERRSRLDEAFPADSADPSCTVPADTR